MANEDDLRRRFRRDFTTEPIRTRPHAQPRHNHQSDIAPKPTAPQTQSVPEPAIAKSDAAPPEELAPPVQLPYLDHITGGHPKPRPVKRKKGKLRRVVLALFVIIVLAGVGAGIAFLKPQPAPPAPPVQHFPAAIKSKMDIALYYPEDLPSGYTVNNDFKIVQGNALYYTVKAPDDAVFYVTTQATPKDFDFQTFESKLGNKSSFSTPVGGGTMGILNSNLVSSIRTDNGVWVTVNTDKLTDEDQLKTISQAFEQSQ